MFVVLAHYGDQLAQAVYQRLCERHGTKNTRLLTGDDLALSISWAMRQDGLRSRTDMRFADGALLASSEIASVFNRLRFAAVPHFDEAGLADREYAVMEMHAFLLSWLSSLECPVVNRASPRSLGGELRGTAEWLLLAGCAGLLSRGIRFVTNARRFPKPQYEPLVPLDGAGLVGDVALKPSAQAILGSAPVHFMEPVGAERRRVVVIDEDVHGDEMPASLRDGCLRLARRADCTLVEFTFARTVTGSDWIFCGANLFPRDLTKTEIADIVRLLESGITPPAQNKR